jgi:hypothetical protein
MLTYSYENLKKLPKVKDAGSENYKDPILDPEITIFLSTGYRIISIKNLFFQQLSITPPTKNQNDIASYFCQVANMQDIDLQDSIYLEINGIKKDLTIDEFSEYCNEVCGEELLYLLVSQNA